MLPEAAAASPPVQPATSSFSMAMRILPAPQRAAMRDIYGFCRAVDDVADGDGAPQDKCAALERWREDVDACFLGTGPAPLASLTRHIRHNGLAREDFHAVIDGMLMDAQPVPICAPPAAILDLYCDRVASAVGRLSVRVFGLPPADGTLLAHHLGRALQLTNILRDIDEDATLGRLYLPREALLHAGITSNDPNRVIAERALPKVCLPLTQRAKVHFEKSDEIMNRNKRRAVRAPRIMSKYYHAILDLLIARGFNAPREPVRVSKVTRFAILFRYAFI
jgi:phytoene synthase